MVIVIKKKLVVLQYVGFALTVTGGTQLHFLYGWTNKSLLAAPFCSVTLPECKIIMGKTFILSVCDDRSR